MSAIADLKVGQIANWYEERQMDTRDILKNPIIQAYAGNFLVGFNSTAKRRRDLLVWMESLRKHHGYRQLILYDAQGKSRLWTPSDMMPPDVSHGKDFRAALYAKDLLITDLHLGHNDMKYIHLSLWIPMGVTEDNTQVAGVLALQIDPYQFLFPLIRSWLTPSRTAEALLVRCEGNNVLYLNELRHRKSTPLRLKLPISRKLLPAGKAALGYEGIMESLNYRNVPVLAATRRVPGTPWFMLAKVDKEEIYAPLHERAWIIAITFFILLLATAMGVSLLWRRQENQWLRKQLSIEQERKRMGEQILLLNAELEQRVIERTAQLEAVNKELEAFSYSVSHDLRAPLHHLSGFVELLNKRSSEALDEKSKYYLTVISDSANKMGILIDELLSFSRIGRAEMGKSPVNLDRLVNEALDELHPDIKGRDIVWKIDHLPDVYGSPAMLRLVLVNLISNALKYTRRRQQAVIEIGSLSGAQDDFCFYIKDNGAGFDMKYSSKLFGMFQRLHSLEEFEGTGVGLANVQRIIQRHEGRTWAEGEVDKGATFYFSIPRKEEQDYGG